MRTLAMKLEALLESTGWRVSSRSVEPEWWIDEQWLLESTWSPLGCSAYVTFLVDPMHDGPRAKDEAVWAVSATPHKPIDRHDCEAGALVTLKEAELREFVRSIIVQ